MTTLHVLTIKTRLFWPSGPNDVKIRNQIQLYCLPQLEACVDVCVFVCKKKKRKRDTSWPSSFLCVQIVLERSCEPGVYLGFTAQSVAFHSRLWLSSWPGPATEAHPGLEALELGGWCSSYPFPPALVWRSPKNMTLITAKK